MQCLMHAPAVYNYLGTTHATCGRAINNCLVCALQRFTERYWNGPNRATRFPGPEVNVVDQAIMAEGGRDRSWEDATDLHVQGDPQEMLQFVAGQINQRAHDL
jgi:hypothetical protein